MLDIDHVAADLHHRINAECIGLAVNVESDHLERFVGRRIDDRRQFWRSVAARQSRYFGQRSVNLAPPSGLDPTSIVPPCRLAIRCTSARPNPEPVCPESPSRTKG